MSSIASTLGEFAQAKPQALDRVGVVGRWFLGALFIYMGWTKALHPELFLKLVRQYDLLTAPPLLNIVAAWLPWLEVFCGLLLVLGVAVRGASLIILLMLVPFTIIVFRRALEISNLQHIALCTVRFDCGCGGGEVWICRKIAENVGLMLVSGLLLTGVGRRFSALFALFREKASSNLEA